MIGVALTIVGAMDWLGLGILFSTTGLAIALLIAYFDRTASSYFDVFLSALGFVPALGWTIAVIAVLL